MKVYYQPVCYRHQNHLVHVVVLFLVKIGLSSSVIRSELSTFYFHFSLMALGLEQNDVHLLIIGHTDKDIQERINSLRYARVRRGKQNPIRAFYTYGSVPDSSLTPWYQIPSGFDVKHIYPYGLLEKVNVVFPPWFRLVKKLLMKCFFFYSSFSFSSVIQKISSIIQT